MADIRDESFIVTDEEEEEEEEEEDSAVVPEYNRITRVVSTILDVAMLAGNGCVSSLPWQCSRHNSFWPEYSSVCDNALELATELATGKPVLEAQ